jgi:hypothetical protein
MPSGGRAAFHWKSTSLISRNLAMKYLMVCFVLLVSSIANAANVQINCPGVPIKPGQTLYIGVTGLTQDEQVRTDVVVTPNDGSVLCLPVNTWGGNSIIIFSAQKPGKYKLEIGLNQWVGDLTEAIAEANTKLNMEDDADKAVSVQLNTAADDLETRYPTAYASCEVEVAGENPPPPPPPPTKVVATVLMLRESKDSTQTTLDLIGDLRTNAKLKNVYLRILDDEAKDSQTDKLLRDDPQSQVAKAIAGAREAEVRLPLIAGFSEDGTLSFVTEAPDNANEFIRLLEEKKVKGL